MPNQRKAARDGLAHLQPTTTSVVHTSDSASTSPSPPATTRRTTSTATSTVCTSRYSCGDHRHAGPFDLHYAMRRPSPLRPSSAAPSAPTRTARLARQHCHAHSRAHLSRSAATLVNSQSLGRPSTCIPEHADVAGAQLHGHGSVIIDDAAVRVGPDAAVGGLGGEGHAHGVVQGLRVEHADDHLNLG